MRAKAVVVAWLAQRLTRVVGVLRVVKVLALLRQGEEWFVIAVF